MILVCLRQHRKARDIITYAEDRVEFVSNSIFVYKYRQKAGD
jgi:hypothetical protein